MVRRTIFRRSHEKIRDCEQTIPFPRRLFPSSHTRASHSSPVSRFKSPCSPLSLGKRVKSGEWEVVTPKLQSTSQATLHGRTYLRDKKKIEKHSPLLHTCSLGGFVEAIRVLMASLASLSAFFPSLPLVISGRMGLLRCRQTKRLRAAQQNTAQRNKNKSNTI